MNYNAIAEEIEQLLRLRRPVIGISFRNESGKNLQVYRHSVPASCAFWTLATANFFKTERQHHLSCSIGAVTHGFTDVSSVGVGCGYNDVDLLVGAGWITEKDIKQLPSVKHQSSTVSYGPMRFIPFEPDGAVLFCNAEQAMVISSCISVKLVGRPACMGVPISINDKTAVISLGCTPSRLRAGYSPEELVVFVPREVLPELIEKLRKMVVAEQAVATAVMNK
ncbi:MAG: DUF169 domain-containing protein [Nitrososphaerota archaeon]